MHRSKTSPTRTSRKHFIASGAALLGAPFLPACTPSAPDQNYAAAASRIWQPLDAAAVLVASANDKAHWVETGRCYQRFALQAAALGIRNAMLSQAVEVPALRQQLAGFVGSPRERPDLVVRFGRGPLLQRSLRCPVEAVMV